MTSNDEEGLLQRWVDFAEGGSIRQQSRIVANALKTTPSTLDQARKMKR